MPTPATRPVPSATVTILAMAGSSRAGSWNRIALDNAVRAARAAGARVTSLDLAALALPIYDPDLESQHGLPAGAKLLQTHIAAHQGLLIATAEYNGCIPPLLLNALCWAARPARTSPSSAVAFQGKVASLLAASTDAGAGMRAIAFLANLLHNLEVTVLPGPLGIGMAAQRFAATGEVLDKTLEPKFAALGNTLCAGIKTYGSPVTPAQHFAGNT